jgi:hypothetical protein
MPLVFPNPGIVHLLGHSSLIVWGRLVTCGGLVIRLVLNRKIIGADYQSAAGYQPCTGCASVAHASACRVSDLLR